MQRKSYLHTVPVGVIKHCLDNVDPKKKRHQARRLQREPDRSFRHRLDLTRHTPAGSGTFRPGERGDIREKSGVRGCGCYCASTSWNPRQSTRQGVGPFVDATPSAGLKSRAATERRGPRRTSKHCKHTRQGASGTVCHFSTTTGRWGAALDWDTAGRVFL